MTTKKNQKQKEARMTKLEAIERHLIRYGSITDPVARAKYHTNRLSGYIHVLRKRGWVIESVWCSGKDVFGTTKYVKYRLVKKGV